MNRRIRPFWSTRHHVIGILARTAALSWLVTTITLFIFIAVVVPNQRVAFLQSLASKAHGVSASLYDIAAGAAVSEDYSAVVEHCTRLIADDPSIEYLILTRKDGFSITHTRDGWRTETLGGEWNPPDRVVRGGKRNDHIVDSEVFRHSRPFDYSGIEWGWIHVGLSLQTFNNSTNNFYQLIGLACLLCMLLSFPISLAYARRISQPVVQLRQAVQRVADGDLSVRASATSRDEVGELAESFNHMTESLLQHEAILQSVWFAAQSFLVSDDWREVMGDVLESIGQAADVSRVYVFRNDPQENGRRLTSQVFEWTAPGVRPELDNPNLQGIQMEELGFARWVTYLEHGDPLTGNVAEFPPEEQILLAQQEIISLAVVPIRVEGWWWGFMGLDECRRSRKWSDVEIVSLRAAADTMGAAIERHQARETLISAKEMAESASRAKSQFLANVSHEIRTPITGVIGMLHLLDRARFEEKQKRYVSNALSAAQTLLAIIGDVLDFSKIEAGRLELEEAPFSLSDTLDSTIRIFAEAAEKKSVELGYRVDEGLPGSVIGDANRLRQVLINLVGNAIKFTEEGQVFIEYALEQDAEDEIVLRCEVRDTGYGIAPEHKETIFESFSQADGSLTRSHGGAGLGLAISRQLCELMGGTIGVESGPDRGSIFWFTARLGKSATSSEPVSELRDLRGIRVLVVDDCATTRHVLREYIETWKGVVADAPDATVGLERLRTSAKRGEPFSLAVLDWKLPGLDGVALAKLIKEDPALQSTGLILLSGYTMSLVASEVADGLFTTSLLKPVRKSDLYNAILVTANGDLQGAAKPAGSFAPDPPRSISLESRGTVLLVEDNDINREVAGEMLLDLGLRYITAKDGAEAVERVASERPDLILMDCQMPVMDGYEATHTIRERERGNPSGTRIPIIALTAHAMKGDRELCLQAGMDGFLSKPVDPRELGSELHKWLPPVTPRARSGEKVEGAPTPAVSNSGSIDFAALKKQYAGKPHLIDRLVAMFADQVPSDLAEIEAALEANDAARLEARAHRLKGSAAHLCAEPIRLLAAELEVHGRENTLAAVGDLAHRLRLLIEELGEQAGTNTEEGSGEQECA